MTDAKWADVYGSDPTHPLPDDGPMFVVAFYVPHNEGQVGGIITGPDFDTDKALVDLYEVDAEIKSFRSLTAAKMWLVGPEGRITGILDVEERLRECPGGFAINVGEDDDLDDYTDTDSKEH